MPVNTKPTYPCHPSVPAKSSLSPGCAVSAVSLMTAGISLVFAVLLIGSLKGLSLLSGPSALGNDTAALDHTHTHRHVFIIIAFSQSHWHLSSENVLSFCCGDCMLTRLGWLEQPMEAKSIAVAGDSSELEFTALNGQLMETSKCGSNHVGLTFLMRNIKDDIILGRKTNIVHDILFCVEWMTTELSFCGELCHIRYISKVNTYHLLTLKWFLLIIKDILLKQMMETIEIINITEVNGFLFLKYFKVSSFVCGDGWVNDYISIFGWTIPLSFRKTRLVKCCHLVVSKTTARLIKLVYIFWRNWPVLPYANPTFMMLRVIGCCWEVANMNVAKVCRL